MLSQSLMYSACPEYYTPVDSAKGRTGQRRTNTHPFRPMLQRRGVGSKNDRRAGTHFFKLGGYKIEPLLTNMVNKVNDAVWSQLKVNKLSPVFLFPFTWAINTHKYGLKVEIPVKVPAILAY